MSILEIELFKGERALVKGAATNIGRAIAVRLAGEGAEVTITDIDKNRLSEVADEISNIGAVRLMRTRLSMAIICWLYAAQNCCHSTRPASRFVL